MSTCWECDSTTTRPIDVTIGMATGHRSWIRLCPPCYQMHYLQLIAQLSGDEAHHDAPAPSRRRPGAGPLPPVAARAGG
jgi:hypothetical protein